MDSNTEVNSKVVSDSSQSFNMYLQFWAGQIFSLLGSAVVMFAIIWELSEMIFMGCGILSIIASSIAIFGKNFHTILSKGEEQANKTETPEEQEQIIPPN